MSRLVLVRHGQASRDRLTDLGIRQAEALAACWIDQALTPDVVWYGTLKRQRETAKAVQAAYTRAARTFPEPQALAGLDEYPAEEIVERLAPRLAGEDETYASIYRAWIAGGLQDQANARFQRMFEPAMRAWLGNRYSDLNIEYFKTFQNRVLSALRAMTDGVGKGATMVAFTSGGPIGVIVQHALAAPDETALELNWRIRNASVTTLLFHGVRLSLDRFNDTAHLNKDELESFR